MKTVMTIAQLAAQRRTNADMEKITETFLKRQGLKENIKENTMADIDFHMAIAAACHNKILYDLYQSISLFLENYISERHIETNMHTDTIDALHEELYIAIKEQKPNVANVCVKIF